MGIEPTYSAWKADVLPLNYTRIIKIHNVDDVEYDFLHKIWSGRQDLNLRPPRPERGALPS